MRYIDLLAHMPLAIAHNYFGPFDGDGNTARDTVARSQVPPDAQPGATHVRVSPVDPNVSEIWQDAQLVWAGLHSLVNDQLRELAAAVLARTQPQAQPAATS